MDPQQSFVFVSEAIENIAPGWQARTTIEILNKSKYRIMSTKSTIADLYAKNKGR